MKTCLAGLMALGLVGFTTDTASARRRLELGRWPSGRRLYRPALQLWRLWLSPSSPLLRSLLLVGTVLAGGTVTAIGTSGSFI